MNHDAYEIKRSVSMMDVCRAYGIEVNYAGFAVCPFHREKTASMKVYPGTRGFACFGCGKAGDVIEFTQDYFEISFRDALAKLNDDFHLGLPVGRKIGPYRRERIAQHINTLNKEKQRRDQQFAALEAAYDEALDHYCRLERLATKYAPKSAQEEPCSIYLYASGHLPDAGYALDIAGDKLYQFKRADYV